MAKKNIGEAVVKLYNNNGGPLDGRTYFELGESETIESLFSNLPSGYKIGEEITILLQNGTVKKYKVTEIERNYISDYELIQEPKDLKYSDGTSFLNENGNINSDPTIDPLPSHSSSDNGKVLGLDNNGNPTWVSQPDTSVKVDKVPNANNNLPKFDSNGNLVDSGISANSVLTSHQDISGKADKVSNATTDNFAALDENGNLKDSGKKSSDFATPASVTAVQNQVSTIQGNYVKTTTSGDEPVMDSSFDPANDCVRVDETQNLTEAKKQIARSNINAINGNDLKTINGLLLVGNGNLVIRSAYEEWLAAGNTGGSKQEFLASLKAQFGSFVPAKYGTDGKPNDGSTDITASADTTNHIYLVNNDPDTPTAKTMWITVVDDSDPVTYNWTSIGDVQVNLTFGSGQQVNAVKIKDENGKEVTVDADVMSAEAGKNLKKAIDGNITEYHLGEVVNKIVAQNGKYNSNAPRCGWYIPVKGGENFYIEVTGVTGIHVHYCVLKSLNPLTDNYADFATGYNGAIVLTPTAHSVTGTIPLDGKYLFIAKIFAGDGTEEGPGELIIDEYDVLHETYLGERTDLNYTKQDRLVSGENIKTINNESILGRGNIEINLDEVKDDLKNIKKLIQPIIVTDNIYSGGSSAADHFNGCRMLINGKSGDTITVELSSATNISTNLFSVKGTNSEQNTPSVIIGKLFLNSSTKITLNADYKYIFIYIKYSNITNSGELTLKVSFENETEKKLVPLIQSNKAINDNGMFELESYGWIMDRYLSDLYSNGEASGFNALKSKILNRKSNGCYQIAIISDSHGTGAYTIDEKETCLRSIAVFNQIANRCDAAVHCGDISCDYGTSRGRILQYMQEVIRKFNFNKPFFITKGNHDENDNQYIEVNTIYLDWDTNTYYIRNGETFSSVTQSTWRGQPLYIKENQLVSDSEFRNSVQHWLCPNGAIWGDGAYYYYDLESFKIRIIVANSFPINDSYSANNDDEYIWFAQEALDLSEKEQPSDWSVFIIRHTQATGIQELASCLNAFMNGTTWTYGDNTITVDFGSVNGGGIPVIAHVHGHEHGNAYSNGAGFLDIGEDKSFVKIEDLGDSTLYGISVWTIDTINKKIYEDCINGTTWVYNYNTNKLEIERGKSVHLAKSGLPKPTQLEPLVSSCDEPTITCNGVDVTIGDDTPTGEYNITISVGSDSRTYSIDVVSNS